MWKWVGASSEKMIVFFFRFQVDFSRGVEGEVVKNCFIF